MTRRSCIGWPWARGNLCSPAARAGRRGSARRRRARRAGAQKLSLRGILIWRQWRRERGCFRGEPKPLFARTDWKCGSRFPFLRRHALRSADLILAPSQDTANQLASQQDVAQERIRVLPWALDPQFEALIAATPGAAPPASFPKGRVILTVGRWFADERYKGMDTLITALPRLLTEWPDVQLVAVGEGDDQGWLEQIADGRGVLRHVHFLSGLTSPEIAACYQACEISRCPAAEKVLGWYSWKRWRAASR